VRVSPTRREAVDMSGLPPGQNSLEEKKPWGVEGPPVAAHGLGNGDRRDEEIRVTSCDQKSQECAGARGPFAKRQRKLRKGGKQGKRRKSALPDLLRGGARRNTEFGQKTEGNGRARRHLGGRSVSVTIGHLHR